jgi:hypothetical protein
VYSLWIRLVANEWVQLLRTTQRKRGPLVIWTDTSSETLAGNCKLDEAIEKPCSDLLAINQRKCILGIMEIF